MQSFAIKKGSNNTTKKMGATERKVTQKETQVEQLRNIRSEVFRRSKLEQIDLPILKGGKKRKKPTKSKDQGKKGKKRKKPTEEEEEEEKKETDEEEKSEKGSQDDEEEGQVDYSGLSKELKDVKTAKEYDEKKSFL